MKHHLFTALLFIFNTSLLKDCITPVVYILNSIALIEDQSFMRPYITKLIIYIKCCLEGKKFPAALGHLSSEDQIRNTKERILGFILLTKMKDLKKYGHIKTDIISFDQQSHINGNSFYKIQ